MPATGFEWTREHLSTARASGAGFDTAWREVLKVASRDDRAALEWSRLAWERAYRGWPRSRVEAELGALHGD
jgi:hypothetical protein